MHRWRVGRVLLSLLVVLPLATPATAGATGGIPEVHRLAEAVTQAMADFPGEYSVAVEDLTTGAQWLLNADRRYHPASTLKLPVALYALEQYRAGEIGWEDLIEYTERDVEPPVGPFETAAFGNRFPVGDLVGWSLSNSNNIAVNMLGRHLGWGNIELWTASIGGRLTHEERLPRASALDVLHWWGHLHRLAQEDPEVAELVVQPLRDVTYRGRISAGLPEGVPHLHKYGSYDGNYHDSGIVYGDRPFILVVMTDGAPLAEADAAIARVTAAVYQVLTESPGTNPEPVQVVKALLDEVGPVPY
ncbi:MAG: serine hydrolase [Symbiobacterium sp.]|uniref:serine hydrolase n=1 Tax=Symbiobacterium sp. TaxID=1971213 RepID=UPI00346420D9